MLTAYRTHVRWAIRRDIPDALPLLGWEEDDYLAFLRDRSHIGLVAERADRVVGVCLYEVYRRGIRAVALAGDDGAKEFLLAKLVGKLDAHRRQRLEVRCPVGDPALARMLQGAGFGLHHVVGDTMTFHLFRA